MGRFEAEYGKWVVKRRWLIIVVAMAVVFISSMGLGNLRFVNDARMFFSEENPQLQALEALEQTFNKEDNVLFVIAPKNGNVFTPENLKAVEELTEKSWQIPFSSRVDSITNFQHTTVEDDVLIVADLVTDPLSLSQGDLERVKRIATSEPLLVNSLISPSGHVTGVNVTIIKPGESITETPETAAMVRGMADEFRKTHTDISLYLTGGLMIDAAFGDAPQRDGQTLIPLMFLALLITLGIILRSVTGTVVTMIIIMVSMVTALGLAGLIGIDLSPPVMNAPTIIMTLAVADSVHILVSVLHQMGQGKTKESAISESLRINISPVFLTSFTTAIGFTTMNFSDAPPFRDLGNIVAMGVMAAFVYSITLGPALLAVLPLKKNAIDPVEGGSYVWDRVANFIIERQKQVFWGMMVFIMVTTAGLFRIELNDNFVKYFDKTYEFRVATDFVVENLSGWDIIELSLDSGEENGINDPAYLNKIEDFAQWWRKQPGVVHVQSLTDIIKRLNRNMNNDDPAYYAIPENRELSAQYLLLYEMSLPYGLDLNNQVNVDKSATRMRVTFRDMTAVELREAEERGREWLTANAPKSMFTHGTGISVMFAYISERNINSMLGASFGALIIISLSLIVAFRSLKLGALTLVPNLVPAFMAFGVWGFLVGRIGLALSVLVAMTLGIVVDDTVHFMSKYLRAKREHNMTSPEAIRYAFHNVGMALFTTTIVLLLGFSILSLSGFKLNSDMGQLTAITLAMALILDFLLLPTLLLKIDKEKKHETTNNDFNSDPAPIPLPSEG